MHKKYVILLNSILFVLIGLTIQIVIFDMRVMLVGLAAIIIVLISRFVSLAIPFFLLKTKDKMKFRSLIILTWGGLRGGISIALALSVGHLYLADDILLITYCVVTFSILVQGLTLRRLVKL